MAKKHGSYSSFLRSEKVAQKKAQRSKMTPDVIKIGTAIIFGISAAVLGYFFFLTLNFFTNFFISSFLNSIIQLPFSSKKCLIGVM